MSEQFARIVAGLEAPVRQGRTGRIRRGIEKEGLRVDPLGRISQLPHPRQLGSKLTHPYITTDYSEALLEFVTPVYSRPSDALDFLADLHRFSYRQLGDELIWPASMPAWLDGNASVPIADFGNSNTGRMKQVYRRGLDVRYGRIMQSIAGIHYNFSLPDAMWRELAALEGKSGIALCEYRSQGYFRLIRNFRRTSWLLMYLFGASPAFDRSFLDGRKVEGFEALGRRTLVSEHASTLRMSDLGYHNKVQDQLKVCFDSLDEYVDTLRHAVSTPWPDYQRTGVEVDGQWQQLNANILQIENEYYSDIRPKRVARHNQTPTQALEADGVEYIEVRCLDINPLLPLGIDETQIRFLDAFLIRCLLADDAPIGAVECARLDANRARVVTQGRDPGLMLEFEDGALSLAEAGGRLFDELRAAAGLLDLAERNTPHGDAVEALAPRIGDPALTPAGEILAALSREGEDFVDWTLERAREQAAEFLGTPMDRAREALLDQLVETSLIQQRDIEADDELSFGEYLAGYFARAEAVAKRA